MLGLRRLDNVNEVVIGSNDGDHLRITVVDRSNRPFFDAEVEIHCRPWSGKFAATFLIGELNGFASQIRELYRELRGPIRFEQRHERFLTLEFKGDGHGHIGLKGIAAARPYEAKLMFELGLEQTELPGIASALEAIDPVSG
jgi:hypothetical protein